MAMAIIIIE